MSKNFVLSSITSTNAVGIFISTRPFIPTQSSNNNVNYTRTRLRIFKTSIWQLLITLNFKLNNHFSEG